MAAGTCAICLADLRPADEAFLYECWHHFHLRCIGRWARCQLGEAPADGGEAPARLSCPLCRRPFASVIYDCHDTAYRRHFFAPAARGARNGAPPATAPAAGSLALTAAHRRRRAAYSTPLAAAARERLQAQQVGSRHAQRPEVEAFARRELQALMLQEDVALVAQHAVGTLRNAATPAAAGARRGAPALAAAAGVRASEAAAAVAAAVGPFLFEHAERFGWELAGFAASGTSLAAFDQQALQLDAAAAAAGAEARQQLQAHAEQQRRQHREHSTGGGDGGDLGWSSGSEGSGDSRRRRSPELQRSDSEGYLELLLLQGQAAQRRAGGGGAEQPAGVPQDHGQAAAEAADVTRLRRSRSPSTHSASRSLGRSTDSGGGSRRERATPPRRRSQHRKHKRRRLRSRDRSRSRGGRGRRHSVECSAQPDAEEAPTANGHAAGEPGASAAVPGGASSDELAALRQRALAGVRRHRQQQQVQPAPCVEPGTSAHANGQPRRLGV